METIMDNKFIPIFFSLLSIALLIHLLIKFYVHKKYYRNFQNIPNLQLPLEGMFVKIEGKVTSQNNLRTPLSKKPSVFYQLQAKGEYEVKRKAPSRGYETVSRTLYSEQSEERVLIDEKNQIFIEIEREQKVILKINKIKKVQKRPLPNYPSHKRATEYIYEEKYLKDGDRVVVFGRLVKKDNCYIVTHTYSEKLPFMIYLNDASELETDYKQKIKFLYYFIFFVFSGSLYLLYTNFFKD